MVDHITYRDAHAAIEHADLWRNTLLRRVLAVQHGLQHYDLQKTGEIQHRWRQFAKQEQGWFG